MPKSQYFPLGDLAQMPDDAPVKVTNVTTNAADTLVLEVTNDKTINMWGDLKGIFAEDKGVPQPEVEEVESTFEDRRHDMMLVYYPRDNAPGKYDAGATMLNHEYYNVRDLLARFFLTVFYEYERKGNWRDTCVGVTSPRNGPETIGPNLHTPMFDFDGKHVRKRIRADVKSLQKNYGLGDAWIFGTKRGYHVYFFCDAVTKETYFEMLGKTQCCKGFRAVTRKRGFATLRVSAKYTKFDIKLLYILRAKDRSLKRMDAYGHTVLSILELGAQCGTHIAALFPKQAYFEEDPSEWRATAKKKKSPGLMPPGKQRMVELKGKPSRSRVGARPRYVKCDPKNWGVTSTTTAAPSTDNEAHTEGFFNEYRSEYKSSAPPAPKKKPNPQAKKKNSWLAQEGCDCGDCERARAKMRKRKQSHLKYDTGMKDYL